MKIVISHVSAGAGHQRAAEAVGAAFHQLGYGNDLSVIDAVAKVDACYRHSFTKGYHDLIRYVPAVWGFLYAFTDVLFMRGIASWLHRMSNQWHGKPFETFLLEKRPDLFIATHFFPAEVAARLKRQGKLSMKVIVAITDYLPHTLWLAPGVDLYAVASDRTKEELMRRGIPENRIRVLGIPIDPKFHREISRPAAAKKLGVDPSTFTLLIASGGLGTGPIFSLVRILSGMQEPISLLIVTGRNTALYEQLENFRHKISHPMKVYGFIDNMEELMAASDIIISKPGGLTCAEAMAKGLPLIAVSPIPGQEERNIRFLEKVGVALYPKKIDQVPSLIRELRGNPGRREEIRRKEQRHSFPDAAFSIARLELECLGV